MTEQQSSKAQPWFVRGDLDGFFGLAIDNLIQFLLVITLCTAVLGFPMELVLGTVIPGAAISVLIGNLFYSRQAQKLSAKTGRTDVTALPYGLNTVSLFAYVFLVMLPVKMEAEKVMNVADASLLAWQIGLASCLTSGLIELGGSFVADWIRRNTPRAALLSTLAGIAISFIAIDFAIQTFESPLVAMLPLAIILTTYFSETKLPLRIPGGAWAVGVGTAAAWIIYAGGGVSPVSAEVVAEAAGTVGLSFPVPVFGDLIAGLSSPVFWDFFVPVMIPMGLFNVLGSLQNIESAEAAGDSYPTMPCLAVNGAGSIVAAAFGSCFPTTIYIGHPGWKGLGARSGYSILNGVFFVIVAVFGLTYLINAIIPMHAGMAIVLWIGIVITAQAFQATPQHHAPAVALGLFPAIAAWGILMVTQTLGAANFATGNFEIAKQTLAKPEAFAMAGLHLDGLVSLSQGFMLIGMIWAAVAASLLDKKFIAAAVWVLIGAGLSFFGFIHAGHLSPAGGLYDIGFASGWQWSVGYLMCAGFFYLMHLWRSHYPEASAGVGH